MEPEVLQVGISVESVTKRYGKAPRAALDDVDLEIRPGELLAVLGPSGGGKSTLLNVLAGLEPVNSGRLRFGDEDVTDIPAERRNVAVVFQSSMLYPHLSLRQSIAFALKMQKLPAEEIGRRIDEVAGWLRIDHLLDRKPHEVSGGERQRSAVAKALVSHPALLLMDEPFSAVDAQLRRQMRTELAKLHRQFGTTTVFVTHDQEEAMSIADRVAVMRAGKLVQVAEPLTLYRQPASAWLADFVSVQPFNLIPVEQQEGGALSAFAGSLVLTPPGGTLTQRLNLGIRPEHLRITRSGSSAFRILAREIIGGQVKYTINTDRGDELVAVRSDDEVLDADTPVDLAVDWAHALAFDPDSGDRLDVRFDEVVASVS